MTEEFIGKIVNVNLEKKQIVLNDKDGILQMFTYPEALDIVMQKQKPGWYKKLTLDDKKVVKTIEYADNPTYAEGKASQKSYQPRNEPLIVFQTCYKECCETARCLMLIPDGAFDEVEYNRLMDVALERAKKDAKALIEAAGEPK